MNERLYEFVTGVSDLLDRSSDEPVLLRDGAELLAALITHDDWLPASHAAPGADRYRQYPLHVDPRGRFSVVSFVWGPGQQTPIHNHGVWGLVGVLRGAEVSQRYVLDTVGLEPIGDAVRLEAGMIDAVSPAVGDIHRVANAFTDRTSISIHLYGGDIGRIERKSYAPEGTEKRFVSGYSSAAGG